LVALRRIAVAQVEVVWNDLSANLVQHLALVAKAAEKRADLILFPELSLTGYPEGVRPDLVDPDDARLNPLRDLAAQTGLVVIAGAPLPVPGGATIGALIFMNGRMDIYTKTILHPGEERHFQTGSGGKIIEIAGRRVALAICAESNHDGHAKTAFDNAIDLYAVSGLVSVQALRSDHTRFQTLACRHHYAVAFANHGRSTGGYETAGRSSIFHSDGKLVAFAPAQGTALIVADI
jgi:predicted amidohydrolase